MGQKTQSGARRFKWCNEIRSWVSRFEVGKKIQSGVGRFTVGARRFKVGQ